MENIRITNTPEPRIQFSKHSDNDGCKIRKELDVCLSMVTMEDFTFSKLMNGEEMLSEFLRVILDYSKMCEKN